MAYGFLMKDSGFLQCLEKAAEYGVRRGCGDVVGSRANKQISEMGRGPQAWGGGESAPRKTRGSRRGLRMRIRMEPQGLGKNRES